MDAVLFCLRTYGSGLDSAGQMPLCRQTDDGFAASSMTFSPPPFPHSALRPPRRIHQLIYAAILPAPGEDAKALGEKRFQTFLDSVAQMMGKGADNDNEPPEAGAAKKA